MKRLPYIAAILALLLQGAAWVAMPMLADAMAQDDARAPVSSEHATTPAQEPAKPHAPCHTHGADLVHAEHAHADGAPVKATDGCAFECGCASHCASVLGASVRSLSRCANLQAGLNTAPSARIARRPDNPYRPPIVNLR